MIVLVNIVVRFRNSAFTLTKAMDTRLNQLMELNVSELVAAFKLTNTRGPWRHIARIPAKRFAHKLISFDNMVGQEGLIKGGQQLLEQFAGSIYTAGSEHLPQQGALIVVSNHPGMMDAMALWVAINREDLKIIAAERELLQHLPHTRNSLIVIGESRTRAFRLAAQHLNSGGALLTFPAGQIEPDSTVRSGAIKSLLTWSPSFEILRRQVQNCILVPAYVKGVISAKAVSNPFLRYLKYEKDRDWAGATLQILFSAYCRVNVSVEFGQVAASHGEILKQMRAMINKSSRNE